MTRAALLLFALLALSPLRASDPWTKADTARELAFTAVVVLDWGTTLDIERAHQESPWIHETNPILGRHPSRAKVNLYIPAGILLHFLAARAMPARWRAAFQSASIFIEAGAVSHNFAVGLRLNF